MKYWKIGRIENGYGDEDGLILIGDDHEDRIISISKNEAMNIVFTEECDGYFSVELTREGAIEALKEAIEWIRQ